MLLIGDLRGALSTGSYITLIPAIPLLVEMLGTSSASLHPLFLVPSMYSPFKIV